MKKRNWKKYGFEFLSIFIAVTSAFALNNWNDNRQNQISEEKILKEIKNGIELDTLKLAETPEIPDDINLLVIADPRVTLLGGEIQLVNRYLQDGGNLLWLVEPGGIAGLDPVAEALGADVPRGPGALPRELPSSRRARPRHRRGRPHWLGSLSMGRVRKWSLCAHIRRGTIFPLPWRRQITRKTNARQK